MSDILYRFRSIENLIGERNELLNQEIYFASPEQLNDPMEGYKDIFWNGDSVLWSNLFRHYTLCLMRTCSIFTLSGAEEVLTSKDIPVFANKDNNPSPIYSDMYEAICTELFKIERINDACEILANRTAPVRQNELITLLKSIHLTAVEIIFNVFEKQQLIPERLTKLKASEQHLNLAKYVELIHEASKAHEDPDQLLDIITSASIHTDSELTLIAHYNSDQSIADRNRLFLLLEFPITYTHEINQLVFPKWYAACFMKECHSPAVWGHYGEGHKGVCLIYNIHTNNDNKYFKLKDITSWGNQGPKYGLVSNLFYPINYTDKFIGIDYFASLGSLPGPVITKFWYTSHEGTQSSKSLPFVNIKADWRKVYWKDFYNTITSKLTDWKKENEFRLILSGPFAEDYRDADRRKLKYQFNDLRGIIFGINTSTDDKIKIMKIIDAKCDKYGRNDFKFYQASYSHETGKIVHHEMSLLQVSAASKASD